MCVLQGRRDPKKSDFSPVVQTSHRLGPGPTHNSRESFDLGSMRESKDNKLSNHRLSHVPAVFPYEGRAALFAELQQYSDQVWLFTLCFNSKSILSNKQNILSSGVWGCQENGLLRPGSKFGGFIRHGKQEYFLSIKSLFWNMFPPRWRHCGALGQPEATWTTRWKVIRCTLRRLGNKDVDLTRTSSTTSRSWTLPSLTALWALSSRRRGNESSALIVLCVPMSTSESILIFSQFTECF